MTATLKIEEMRWPQVAEALEEHYDRVVIPLGSTEQHGPHLPEGTDAYLAEALATRLAEQLGSTLVAPVIRPGCSDHHMDFPGTISISPELMTAILDAYVASLRSHGFSRFVVFSAHGGNFPVLTEWQQTTTRGITVISDLLGFTGAMLGALRDFGRDDDTLPHADLCETAEMLTVRPELVEILRAERGFVGAIDLPTLLRSGLRAVTPNGILGDARGATAEIGEHVIDQIVQYLFNEVVKAETQDIGKGEGDVGG
jgi:creatinine amidohydrolase